MKKKEKAMLSNFDYNIFGNLKTDELSSVFNTKSLNCSNIRKTIDDILSLYCLTDYCNRIFINNSDFYCASYSFNDKAITINYNYIMKSLFNISKNDYFATMYLYRIVLHEIKHVFQYKMLAERENNLYKIFENEFLIGNSNYSKFQPSELNANFDSSLTILKLYDYNDVDYERQLIFVCRLINNYCFSNESVLNYCKENNINIFDTNLIDSCLYGLTKDINKYAKLILKRCNID